jgi:hypothetical protein
MNDLELELIKVGNQINEASNIQEVEKLFFEMRNKYESVKENKLTEKVRKTLAGSLVFVIYKLREFYEEWGKNRELLSNKKELITTEKIIKEVFKNIDKISKEDFPSYFSEDHRSEAKKGLIDFRMKIDEEKDRLKVHYDGNK